MLEIIYGTCKKLFAVQHHHKDQIQTRIHKNGMGIRGSMKNKKKKIQSKESYYNFDNQYYH